MLVVLSAHDRPLVGGAFPIRSAKLIINTGIGAASAIRDRQHSENAPGARASLADS
jgi:hypothetical protein